MVNLLMYNLQYKNMSKKSKILLIVMIILVMVCIGYTFNKTIIKGDFDVTIETEEQPSMSEE